MVWSAASGERSEVRVDFDTTPIEAALIGGACSRSRNGSEASAERGGVYLIGANFSRARARRSRADALRQQTDPLEPAGRRFANFFFEQFFFEIFRFWGERWSSGVRGPQSDRLAGAACWPPSPVPEFGLGLVRPPRRRIRWCGRRRRASAARYGVDFDTTPIEAALIGGACLARATALKHSRKGRRLPYWREFLACAREAEPSDALRQQTDPLEPAGRRFANFFFEQFFFEIFRFWGERWSSGVRGPQ